MPETTTIGRRLYQAAYTTTLDDPDTPAPEPVTSNDTSEPDPDTAEEKMWKKRYADLRSHTTGLTERINSLETQLQAANQKEIKIPSTKDELESFMQKYPDVYRHIRSIAMQELMQERESFKLEQKRVEDDLSKTKRELGLAKILKAHPDFHEINLSHDFQEWSELQPSQIQDWLFNSDDPLLCIKALDLFKAETGYKKPKKQDAQKSTGADMAVVSPKNTTVDVQGNKKIWTASEIGKMHPRDYEKYEDEIDLARVEGRFNPDA